MVAESVHFEGHPEWAAELRAHVRAQRPRLTHRLVEAEMVRRHQPMLVRDPQNDPRTFRPLVVASDTRSYVAAPIMPEGRVIGLMHADSYFTGRTMDELDRDTLATFTEGLGYAIERAILVDRLHTQRDEVSRMIRNTDQIISEVFELDMEPTHAPVQGDARRASSSMGGPPGTRRSLAAGDLTRREMEVLEQMAKGLTNWEIAERLVVSEGTVKSHAKHVLRKLSAANRAQAASIYSSWQVEGST